MHDVPWVDLVSCASGFEADITVARLEADGIPAMRDNNETTGIFGPGFQGASAFGITVQVPAEYLEEARALLAQVQPIEELPDTDGTT